MTIFNEVKNVIIDFVNNQFINERTGRLISKKINNCLIENNYMDYVINNEIIKKENKKLINKNNYLKIENTKLSKKIISLQKQINTFQDKDNELFYKINNNNNNTTTVLFYSLLTIFYEIIVGIVYSLVLIFMINIIIQFYYTIDFNLFNELKYDMDIYVNLSKYTMNNSSMN